MCGEYCLAHYGIDLPVKPFGYGAFRYWYLGAYIKLMLLTLAINPLLDMVARLQKKFIVLISVIFVSVNYLSLLWFPWVSHSPRTIVFIYIVLRLGIMVGMKSKRLNKPYTHRYVGFALLGMLMLIIANGTFHNQS